MNTTFTIEKGGIGGYFTLFCRVLGVIVKSFTSTVLSWGEFIFNDYYSIPQE